MNYLTTCNGEHKHLYQPLKAAALSEETLLSTPSLCDPALPGLCITMDPLWQITLHYHLADAFIQSDIHLIFLWRVILGVQYLVQGYFGMPSFFFFGKTGDWTAGFRLEDDHSTPSATAAPYRCICMDRKTSPWVPFTYTELLQCKWHDDLFHIHSAAALN